MALVQHETVFDVDDEPQVGSDAYTFPQWLANLDPEAIKSLREVAFQYSESQNLQASEQERLLRSSGVVVERMSFPDAYKDEDDREFVDTIIESMTGLSLLADDTRVHQELQEGFKALSPALRYWREQLVPTSAALALLRRPDLPILPGKAKKEGGFQPGIENDPIGRVFFEHGMDARAIRNRGEAVRAAYVRHFMDQEAYPKGSEVHLASLACGAAEDVLSAVEDLVQIRPDLAMHIHLVDIDEQALVRARQFVESRTVLRQLTIKTYVKDLVSGASMQELKDEIGQSLDAIDIVGFFEYLRPRTAKKFMERAYSMLGDNGLLCAGNMRNTHPLEEFTKKVVDWPFIVSRSLQQFQAITQEACGRDTPTVSAMLPEDGGYAILNIRKN